MKFSFKKKLEWEKIRQDFPLACQQLVLYLSDTKNELLLEHSLEEIIGKNEVFLLYINKVSSNKRRLYEFFDRFQICISIVFEDQRKKEEVKVEEKKSKKSTKKRNWKKEKEEKKEIEVPATFEIIFRFRINSPVLIHFGSKFASRKLAELMAFHKAFEVLEDWLKAST